MDEVSRFYLGPLATVGALLDANKELASKYKDYPPGRLIYLDAGTGVRIPVPQKWIVERFGHGLKP